MWYINLIINSLKVKPMLNYFIITFAQGLWYNILYITKLQVSFTINISIGHYVLSNRTTNDFLLERKNEHKTNCYSYHYL